MAILLFKLNGVPQDEADEIRALLHTHEIDYYETEQGNWGISLAAIWLPDDRQRDQAENLIDEYQRERYRRARQAYEEKKRAGELEGILERAWRDPVRFILYLLAILAILYLSFLPFIRLAD